MTWLVDQMAPWSLTLLKNPLSLELWQVPSIACPDPKIEGCGGNVTKSLPMKAFVFHLSLIKDKLRINRIYREFHIP